MDPYAKHRSTACQVTGPSPARPQSQPRFQTIPPFRATAGDLKQSEKGKIPIAIGQICQKFDSRRVYPVLLE